MQKALGFLHTQKLAGVPGAVEAHEDLKSTLRMLQNIQQWAESMGGADALQAELGEHGMLNREASEFEEMFNFLNRVETMTQTIHENVIESIKAKNSGVTTHFSTCAWGGPCGCEYCETPATPATPEEPTHG